MTYWGLRIVWVNGDEKGESHFLIEATARQMRDMVRKINRADNDFWAAYHPEAPWTIAEFRVGGSTFFAPRDEETAVETANA
jgi:hypothetical protein